MAEPAPLRPARSVALGLAMVAAGCAAGAAPAPPAPETARVARQVMVMGTLASVVVEAPHRDEAMAASEAAIDSLEATERRLSTWGTTSELARLNAAPAGEPVPLSPELARDLAAARRCWERTDGAFDPGLGALVAAWGLRDGGRRPSAGELRAARAASGLAHLDLDDRGADGRTTAVRRHPGLVLEEGAFGKGAGLDRAVEAALEAASAWGKTAVPAVGGETRVVIDLGGQVAVASSHRLLTHRPHMSRLEPPRIVVAHPDDRRPLLELTLPRPSGSVATSGNGERGIVVDGARLGHLLDPQTGRPAPDFGSLTVWAPSALDADCLATGLYVLGPDEALERASRWPMIEALALVRGPGGAIIARATAGLAGRLQPVGGDTVEIVFVDPPEAGAGETEEGAHGANGAPGE